MDNDSRSNGHIARLRRFTGGLIRTAIGLGLVTLIGLATYYFWPQPAPSVVASYTVHRADLEDSITENGTLECVNVEHGFCEVRGFEMTIVSIVDEGTEVSEGDLVCKFDDAEITKQIAEQETLISQAKSEHEAAIEELNVQKNTDAAAISTAQTEVELAELAKEKYLEGDFPAEKEKLNSVIALAEANLEKSRDDEQSMRELVRKGYREYEQLEEVRQRRISEEFNLAEQKLRLSNLEKYTQVEQTKTLTSKVVQAQEKLARAKADAAANLRKGESKILAAKQKLENLAARLGEMTEVLSKTEIKAKRKGKVRYANEEWYDESRRIRVGLRVYPNQKIFYLPDTSEMKVKLKVDEAVINKLQMNQAVRLTADAYVQQPLKGKVSQIAAMAVSDWRDERNRYDVEVLIDSIPENMKLMPGMTCNAEIHVATHKAVLSVPAQAIVQVKNDFYAYIKNEGQYEAVKVELGPSNVTHVVVKKGLTEGSVVALDAYARSLTDFKDELDTPNSNSDETEAEASSEIAMSES